MEVAAPLARLLLYVGAMIAIGRGTLTFLDSDTDGEQHPPRAVRAVLWVGAVALVVAPLLLLSLQQRALELPAAEVLMLLRDTTWGVGWTQLAVPCLITAMVLTRRASRTSSLLLVMAALGVAVAMGGLGHAAADAEWPVASRALDAMHVAGMGAWIGSLLLMVLAGTSPPHPSAAEWQAFSRTATVMAPVTVLSGLAASWLRVGASAPADILASDYGRLLLLKVGVVGAVLAIGFTQRERIAAGAGVTRAVVMRELALAAVVLVVTAWLTGTEPPGG